MPYQGYGSYRTSIVWGEHPERGDEATTYLFNTEEELDAFLKGVNEAGGYLNYSFEEEGFVVPDDDDAYWAYHENRSREV